jgi:hypothetical protein
LKDTHQLLVYAAADNLLDKSIHTIKKNIEASLFVSNEIWSTGKFLETHTFMSHEQNAE